MHTHMYVYIQILLNSMIILLTYTNILYDIRQKDILNVLIDMVYLSDQKL